MMAKNYFVRLVLAFVIFIGSSIGTGYILGQVYAYAPTTQKLIISWNLTGELSPYVFLIGIALGGIYGIVAGRELMCGR